MTRAYVALRVRLNAPARARTGGQGTLEYVGMVVAVAVVLGAVIVVIGRADLAAKLRSVVSDVFGG